MAVRPGPPKPSPTAGFGKLWAILLAAGDGRRVEDFTSDPSGAPVPKQFWAADGRQSMLRWAIERAGRLVSTDRLLTVVALQHRCWWSRELSDLPFGNIVIQPQNKGTAVGLLLPLLEVLRRDPLARVVVLPSDHYVADERILSEAILDALTFAERHPDRVVLLGMRPNDADVEYGWIVPASREGTVHPVARFHEKPAEDRAKTLMKRGAVLNSLILVATGMGLLGLFNDAVPRLADRFAAWFGGNDASPTGLESLYHGLATHDFSREVLEHSIDRLDVLNVDDCGWSDLGTPSRLLDYYRQASPRRAAAGARMERGRATGPPSWAAATAE